MKHLIFKLFLFPFLLISFSSHLIAEDENGNTCNEAQAILPAGLLAASDSGSSADGDKDYFSFTVDANGELNVTISNTSDNPSRNLEYATLTLGTSPCSELSGPSNLAVGATTTQTITVTTAGTYYIYLEGTKSSASTYTVSALFTPGAPTAGTDLSISKTGSVDSLLIFDTFFYTINVSNVGDTNASNVTVTDSLPSNMRVDITATNASLNSTGWTCAGATISTTCTLSGELKTGILSTIELHVKAPPTDGNITNEVNVTSSADGITIDTDVNPANNTATEITEVVSDIDTAEHLCYDERTEILNAEDFNTTCEIKGNFYYGSACEAYVSIYENNVTDVISSPKIYKMYAPATSSGSCSYTAQGSTFTDSDNCNNISNSNDFGSFEDGYAIILDENYTSNLEVDIYDIGTDHNPRIDGIAMFADYTLEVNDNGTDLRFHHFGRIFACSGISEGGIEITSSADTIDTPIGDSAILAGYYNGSFVPNPVQPSLETPNTNIKYIQTMVAAGGTRTITGVHLNVDGVTVPYQYLGSQASDIPYSITPFITTGIGDDSTGGCALDFEPIIDPGTGTQLIIDIPSGDYAANGNMLISDVIRENARIRMIFIDPNGLSAEGQNCLANSSTTGNFARLAQCVNSEVQYKTAFGQDAWDRCGTGNGNPCLSTHGGWSCGESDTTCDEFNPIYNNDLGCYLCTFNIVPSCSTDNFAIRPDHFDAAISHADGPNLLRSGEGYSSTLIARNIDDSIASTYTVFNFHNVVNTTTPKKYFNGTTLPWIEDVGGSLLHGSTTVTPEPTSHMINGISSLDLLTGTAEGIVDITFDDVARVSMYITDPIWSEVDNDDTPMDCNSTNHTYICGELNATFIPHHFSFEDLNITNQAGPDSNLTYIANKRGMPETNLPIRSPMAARVHTRIEARNQQGAITENFRENFGGNLYYENNISVNQTVKIPTTRVLPNDPDAYLFPEANESKITNKLVGFGRTGTSLNPETDAAGTRNLKWNESTYPLEFNFKRELQQIANPFDVNGSFFSIALTSDYVDPNDGDTATVEGSRIGDKNTSTCVAPPAGSCVQSNALSKATFYYARTRASKELYTPRTGISSVLTPIAIDIYCDLGFTVCADYDVDTTNGQTNNFKWWLSWNHNANNGDGNVTLVPGASPFEEGSGNPTIDGQTNASYSNIMITASGVSGLTTVARGGAPFVLPMLLPIELVNNINTLPGYSYRANTPYTNSWLIYNPRTDSLLQALPDELYKVRFIDSTTWVGVGETGYVLENNASTYKTNRLDW